VLDSSLPEQAKPDYDYEDENEDDARARSGFPKLWTRRGRQKALARKEPQMV